MLVTIEGVYRSGRVELDEAPEAGTEARVLVTFLPQGTSDAERRSRLKARAFERMAAGLDLGGSPYPSRESLHER
jgi:hypothetical protein